MTPRVRDLVGLAVVVGAATLVAARRAGRRVPTPAASSVPVAPPAASSAPPVASAPPSPSASPPAVVEAGATQPGNCEVADRGFGRFAPWKTIPGGRLLAPSAGAADGHTLVVHFHGAEAARKLLADTDLDVVLVGVDRGTGSRAYEDGLTGAEPIEELLEAAAAASGAAHGRLVLSAWSAGYGAVRSILVHHPRLADAVVLLDGLHVGYDEAGQPSEPGLAPFVALAARAQTGDGRFVITHSAIVPPGYASTRQCADHVVAALGARRRYAGLELVHGVRARTEVREQGLLVRGTTGQDRAAHCAHLKMLPAMLREVLASPR